MKLEQTFTVPEDEATVRARVAEFLGQAGYRPVASQRSMTFRRGEILGFASFSPKGWRVNATIQVAPSGSRSQVSVTLDVDTTLQWVTEKERAFWKAELDCLRAAATTGIVDTQLNTQSARSARTQNVLLYVLIIGMAMGFGIGARALFPSPLAYWAGLVVGGVMGLLIAWPLTGIKRGGG